jgi:elongation factor 2
MPRFKQFPEIQKLLNQKERIRNIGIIAHIDHGKTTLADTLLAGAGLLSPQMAGAARVLDFLEEEQKRKITIKTASISLLYKTAGESYVVNLVDTPGHVDFTGKVTRALRVIDGAVVVVDAVEEIMAQTEIVTMQALEERVRPMLFINKVDRLITELQLTAEQVERKLNRIISSFNDLLELHAEAPFKTKWKIDPSADNVAFGSALHGWGFTLSSAKNKGVKFSDVINAYRKGEPEKLGKLLPIHHAVFGMAVKSVPNPQEAQQYRVEKVWKGNLNSEVGQAMVDCSERGPVAFSVTNVLPNGESTVAVGRLFSGTINEGDKVYLVNAKAEAVVAEVSIFMGAFKESVRQISSGTVAALTLQGQVKAGETVVSSEHKESMVPFEAAKYTSEPVVTVSVEPKNPKDMPALMDALDRLVVEDPSLTVTVNPETGEYLLSGMGELHLEIALNRLKSLNSEVEIAEVSPRVVYRESITKVGAVASARSPNKQNRFTVQVESLKAEPNDSAEAEGVLAIDQYGNVLENCMATKATDRELLEFVIAGFGFACGAGPLCGEPMRRVKVCLRDAQFSKNVELSNSMEVMHGVGKAIFGSFLTAQPVLLEPIYRTVISVPADLAGECTRILSGRRGKVSGFEQKGAVAVIVGFIPVAETLGLSKELRSATSGRAFWQSLLDRWEPVPEKLALKVISEIRGRKGLPSEVPATVKFVEDE